jgi:D-inositol-3-phosphate glycosyltransferase
VIIKPLRIAMLSIHSSPLGRLGAKDTGGMSTYLLGLSGALGAAGHRVDLFTRVADQSSAGVLNVAHNVRLVSVADHLGILNKNELYPHAAVIAEAVQKFCRGDGAIYDLIFSHYWVSGVVGQLLQQSWKRPHLIMFHTLGRAKIETCRGESEPERRIIEEEQLANSCDLVVTAAQSEKHKLIAYYGLADDKIALVPCGVDRELFRPLDSRTAKEQSGLGGDRERIILAVGRVEPVKGFELLIRAAAYLPIEDNCKVVIVGGDAASSDQIVALKETAAHIGLQEKLLFTGLVDHDQLPLYYNAAAVTAIPSHYESFGLVALESLACGTPLVAGPVGVLPELIIAEEHDPCGSIVQGRDPVFWAAAIRQIYLQSGQIAAAEIETRLAPYSWPAAAEAFVSLVEKLI